MIFCPVCCLIFPLQINVDCEKIIYSGAGGLTFKSRDGQTGHNVANRCDISPKGLCYLHVQ